MKKVIVIFIVFLSLNICGICQSGFSSKISGFKSIYSGWYDYSNGYINYIIGPLDKSNNWHLDLVPEDLFTNKELKESNLDLDKSLLNINDNIKINLYRKYPVPQKKNDYPNPGYVVVFENENNKEILFYRIKDIKHWSDYPVHFYDTIVSEDLNDIYILYMDYEGSFFYLYINRKEKITIREKIPPIHSLHTSTINFNSICFWSDNLYRCKGTDGSITYFKLYVDYDDFIKNKNNGSINGKNRLICWNNKGKIKINETDKSWDYFDNEPEFNLDGWYHNEINNKSDL